MDVKVRKTIKVPMRDGVELGTDVYQADDEPHPVVLLRSPYDKDMSVSTIDALKFLRAGYILVAQDTRGRFTSGGTFNPFFDECHDGEDTLRWIAQQSWCNGDVAMVGPSYSGAIQWMVAAGDAPALKAIAPNITASSYYEGWTYQGGAFELGFTLTWTVLNLSLPAAVRAIEAGEASLGAVGELITTYDDIWSWFKHTPLGDIPVVKQFAPYYDDWLAHATDDDFWRQTAPRERYEDVTVPSLNFGGWYDCFLGGTLENYQGIKLYGGSDAARKPRLVIGPWAHGTSLGEFPSGSFGLMANAAVADVTAQTIRFFDRHLRGIENGLDDEPPVRIFVMGANQWRNEQDWPLPDTHYVAYYLDSAGHANSDTGDGGLVLQSPTDEASDVYLYDPRNPVATTGGQTFLPGLVLGTNCGPRDRREIEGRSDVLCYSTPALAADTEVTGPISLVLHASSSAVDTDFTGALVDVHPDGRAMILTEGIVRARYRNSTREAELLEPGRTYELQINLWATSNVFKAGHQIRLEVSSSNFPRFDRNSNTGGIIATETESVFIPAVNRIFHGGSHPSRLVLPIIAR
jgi:putative CocE/NonD family hydrolase